MLYPSSISFYCYGCGTGGSIIDFVSMLFHISPLEAGKKLSQDFGLNLFTGKTPKEVDEQVKKRQEESNLLRSFEQWEQSYYLQVCDNIRLLETLKTLLTPNSLKDITSGYAAVINELQILEYHWNILFNGNTNDRIELYLQSEKRDNVA